MRVRAGTSTRRERALLASAMTTTLARSGRVPRLATNTVSSALPPGAAVPAAQYHALDCASAGGIDAATAAAAGAVDDVEPRPLTLNATAATTTTARNAMIGPRRMCGTRLRGVTPAPAPPVRKPRRRRPWGRRAPTGGGSSTTPRPT